MNQKINYIIIVLLVLIIGFGIGYFSRGSCQMPMGGHMMSDGMMMEGHDMDNAMDGAMNDMMAGLEGKTGDEFDKAFLSEMIMHHQGAVAMAQAALQNARHAELKQMAKNIISAQSAEISQMQQWQKSWYSQAK